MTQLRLLSAGLRLAALWLAFVGFQSFAVVIVVQRAALLSSDASWAGATPALMFLAAAFLLWQHSLGVASRLLPPEAGVEVAQMSPRACLKVGCALLGLWLISHSLPLIMRLIALEFLAAHRATYSGNTQDQLADVIFLITEFAIAFMLIMKNSAIVQLVLGNAGRNDG